MNKVVTLRLTEDEYNKILLASRIDHRPISSFITISTLKQIEESYYVDPIEMAEIRSNKKLNKKLKAGYQDAKAMRGKFVG
ncbi:MAG: hypothetical protein A3I11_01895 [Elusimicrobia bacterium RIFCSPLOWO2_02_FULL_39_32]|nr:MAG: hypothetical protein A3I11_01895 [Elusimicrobia bacterium RIFCSPLOWO2_02_FULL_39_32]